LPRKSLNINEAIEILRYHTHRNHVAYKAHRKKNVRKAESWGIEVSL